MTKNRNRKSNTREDNPKKIFGKRIIKGAVTGLISFFLMLLMISVAVIKIGLSDTVQTCAVFFSAFISSFLGSLFSCKNISEKGYLTGVITSLPIICTICIVLIVAVKNVGLNTLLMSLLMLSGGAVGGIVAVNGKHR